MPNQPANPETGKIKANTIEELRYLQQIYQNQYSLVGQEIDSRLAALEELGRSLKTLENADSVAGKGSLIHVGASVYMTGTISKAKSVVVGVGAGYLVEKSVDEAKGYISDINEREVQSINKLNKTKKDIESALVEISYKAEEMSH